MGSVLLCLLTFTTAPLFAPAVFAPPFSFGCQERRRLREETQTDVYPLLPLPSTPELESAFQPVVQRMNDRCDLRSICCKGLRYLLTCTSVDIAEIVCMVLWIFRLVSSRGGGERVIFSAAVCSIVERRTPQRGLARRACLVLASKKCLSSV